MEYFASASPPTNAQYNRTLLHPTVRATLNHLAKKSLLFNSRLLICNLATSRDYPAISVRELLSGLKSAGLDAAGFHANITELRQIPYPFLTFLKTGLSDNAELELIQVLKIGRQQVALSSDRFGKTSIRYADFVARWSGIVVIVEQSAQPSSYSDSDLELYRSEVSVINNILEPELCKEMISYCETTGFSRSRVHQRRNEAVSNVIQTRFRSSMSTVLYDRSSPILTHLYKTISDLEGVSTEDIETIQCVRYKIGQRFRSHYDAGIGLPRLTTYLLYLNDDYTGGGTYFPMLDYEVAPQAGACLRFPSCYPDGRVRWQSEHGGLPVQQGVKYALNIWVHCRKFRMSFKTASAADHISR